MDTSSASSNPTRAPTPLRRALGPLDATCVVIGAIIGVGIFFAPTRVAALAGSGPVALLAWAVGGLIALCGALTFAELGTRYPHAGGQYEILRDAYGPLPAFLFVFCNATAIQAGAIAIIALICGQNLVIALGIGPPSALGMTTLATTLIAAVTAANAIGVRWGARIQNLTVAAKLAALAGVVAVALLFGTNSALAPALPGSGPPPPLHPVLAVCAALVPAFFAYGGWQHALWMAGEIRQPRRNLPLAIVLGVLIVVVVYIAVNWAFLQLLGHERVARSAALAADAVAVVWPRFGGRIIASAVAVSAFGVLNAQLLSGPRLIFRMAEDGRFFAPFARVNPSRGTPLPAIVLLGGLGTALLLLAATFSADPIDTVDRLTVGVVAIDGVFFVLTGLALFLLRRRDAHGLEAPRLGYPFAPALFVLGELGLLIGSCADSSKRSAAITGAVWIAAALLVYFVFFRGARNRPSANA